MTKRSTGASALILIFALGVLATSGTVEAGGAGVTLELVPSSTAVLPGDVLTVDVVISGLGDFASPAVGAFDFDLLYDETLFTFLGVSYGPFLGDPAMAEAIVTTIPSPGSVDVAEVSLLTPADLVMLQPSSFLLLTASYEAIAPGTGVFDLTPDFVGDEDGLPVMVDAVIPATVTSGSANIPTLSQWGLILLIGGLLAAGVARLRRVRS